MKKRDIDFFERYKKLDVVIGDMLCCNNGVSEYIRQMEQTVFSLQKKVETWDRDYKTLKHLRWVRNKIAHETNSEIESVSTQKDMTSLIEFSKKLSNGKDPLSIIHKRFKKASNKKKIGLRHCFGKHNSCNYSYSCCNFFTKMKLIAPSKVN